MASKSGSHSNEGKTTITETDVQATYGARRLGSPRLHGTPPYPNSDIRLKLRKIGVRFSGLSGSTIRSKLASIHPRGLACPLDPSSFCGISVAW
jgi:hypothetical protein